MPRLPSSSTDSPRWGSLVSIAVPLIAGAAGIALVLSGCASTTAASAPAPASSAPTPSAARVSVVASTSVYGDIAEQIGGDSVSVTSIIDDPNRDPHEYQADGQNQLSISKADIVIENGAGYDDFVDTMLASSKKSPVVLSAAAISGYDLNPSDGDFNEHLWYDFGTVAKVADQLSVSLAAIDPSNAVTYRANAASFGDRLSALVATEASIKAEYAGRGVAITEPVALYLTDAVGLVDRTSPKFSDAVENGTDVAPDVLAQTLGLFSGAQVALLVYNSQTSGPQTDQVVAAAHAAGVPVVPVTETLPQGMHYLDWMTDNLAAVQAALSQ